MVDIPNSVMNPNPLIGIILSDSYISVNNNNNNNNNNKCIVGARIKFKQSKNFSLNIYI